MMALKAVGFDWGGVIHGRPGIYFNEQLALHLDVSVDEFEAAYFSHNQKVSAKQITAHQFWALVLDDLDRSHKLESAEALIREITESKEVIPEMLRLVDELRTNGYKVGLLSNNTQAAANQMRRDGVDQHFDAFVVSAEVSVSKPDPEIFDYFTKQLKVEPAELVFIDDSPKSLASADVCGFIPLLFTDYEVLLKDLQKLGVILS